MNRDPHSQQRSTQPLNRVEVERAMPPASWRRFTFKAVLALAGLACAALFAHALWFATPAQAQVDAPPLALVQNLGSPDFANPSEIRYRAAEKRMRGVMLMRSGNYSIPNVGTATLRQYGGWDPALPAPDLTSDAISPGPTLRA